MRSARSWLLAAAVAALVVAAVVDALVGSEPAARPSEPTPPARTTENDELARALRERGIGGSLVYTDEDCEVHELRLPPLVDREVSVEASCTFAAPSPRRGIEAECDAGVVEVSTAVAPVGRTRGCAPAWTPSGALTIVRDGELVEVDVGGTVRPLPTRVLVSRGDLARDLTGPPWAIPHPAIREAAWLADDLVALVVSDPAIERDDVLVLYRGRRFVGAPPFPYERLSALRVSPRGSFVAARVGLQPSGLVVVDRRGELIAIPFRVARAITWSPDERWTAVASPDTIFIWETGERAVRFVPLPIRARDVAWF
jgi:hypothetical protein